MQWAATLFPLRWGNFNGDGKSDLVMANYNGNTVSVLLGNGDGTFQAQQTYTAGAAPGDSVAIADFNGDGKSDVVVVNIDDNDVTVLFGNGDGTFKAAVNYGVGNGPYSVAVGDVNGDGRADLVVANEQSNNISVLPESPSCRRSFNRNNPLRKLHSGTELRHVHNHRFKRRRPPDIRNSHGSRSASARPHGELQVWCGLDLHAHHRHVHAR